MAGAHAVQNLQDEATCSICLQYYRDPVMTDCGHNFCRPCITQHWEVPGVRAFCPECRRVSPQRTLRPNRKLLSIAEMVKELCLESGGPQEGSQCQEHQEKLKLFCREEERLVCVVCSMASEHKSHTVVPIREAALEYKGKLQHWLHPLEKEKGGIMASKRKQEESSQRARDKIEAEKQKCASEFEGMHELLRVQEQAILTRLAEMERKVTLAEKAKVSKLSQEISALNTLITEIETKSKQPEEELLKDVRETLGRCENVTFRKLGKNLKSFNRKEEHFNTQEGSRKSVKIKDARLEYLKIHRREKYMTKYRVLVTLDPDTANRFLTLSEDGRRVAWKPSWQPRSDHHKRFTASSCVLGVDGLSSGKHSWEVQLIQDKGWNVGVAQESVCRKERVNQSPEAGVWALFGCNGQYEALTSPPTRLSPHRLPKKLMVHLDYEWGQLSLYNADTMELLYTFNGAPFTEKLYPYFWIGLGTDLRLV